MRVQEKVAGGANTEDSALKQNRQLMHMLASGENIHKNERVMK